MPANALTYTNVALPNVVVPYVPWSANGAGVYDSTRAQQFAISNWLGMLNSEEAIDTDILGDVRVTLTLADTQVLAINELTTNPTSISYTLSGVYFSITTLSLAPEQAQALFLDRMGTIERKMNLWWAFQGSVIAGTNYGQQGQIPGTQLTAGSPTTTVNFSLSSQSVDLLLGAFLTVPDTSKPWLCRYDADQNYFQFGTSAFKGLAFKRPGNFVQDYQFSVNNVAIPSYRIAASEAFQHLLIQLNLSNETIQGTTTPYSTTTSGCRPTGPAASRWRPPLPRTPASSPASPPGAPTRPSAGTSPATPPGRSCSPSGRPCSP